MAASMASLAADVDSLTLRERPRSFQGAACEATAAELALVREELGFVPSNVVRVAAETPKARRPAVLLLYPLRSREAAHKKRQRAAVEPFPTVYWLASRELKARVSALEDRRFVQLLERRMVESAAFRKRMEECHESYARERWGMLTPSDRELVERNGWTRALRDVGVAGIRNFAAVKCLHTHYAHFLATGNNLVGEWVHELLQAEEERGANEGGDAKTCSSTSSDAGE